MMKKAIAILVLAYLFICCEQKNHINKSLDRAEYLISYRPDSALMVLDSIGSGHFGSNKQTARYALLKSIAFDKNYIDLTDDSLINIAVNYYSNRHNAINKFKSYFYQARIYQNAGQMDKAMKSLTLAEHVNKHKIDASDLARLHIAKSRILISRYDHSESLLEELKKVEEYSWEAGKTDNYASSLLEQANTHIINKNYQEATACLNLVKNLDSLSNKALLNLNEIHLLLTLNSPEHLDSLGYYVKQYIASAKDSSLVDWKIVAQTYSELGEDFLALKSLKAHSVYNDIKADESYYYLLSCVYASLGDFQHAYENLETYSNISDSLDMVKIKQEVNSVKENMNDRLSLQRLRFSFYIFAFLVCIVMILGILYLLYKHREKHKLEREYHDLMDEYAALNETKKRYQAMMISDEDEYTLKILERRIKALGTFLSKDIPDSLSKVADKLEDLTQDRNVVTESIGMLYAMYHPNFVLKLGEYGLTASEVGFCCLLILGLRLSELSPVIKKANAYNVSGRIRSKLKIEPNASKLSTWLEELYRQSGQSA